MCLPAATQPFPSPRCRPGQSWPSVDEAHEHVLLPGTLGALRTFKAAGLLCPVVTVQSRIEKGLYSEKAFLEWFESFRQDLVRSGAEVLGPYICPHRHATACECAKPKPTLYLAAARDLGVDCGRSFVVGDTGDDIRAGLAIGATPCLVETGWQPKNLGHLNEDIAFVGADLLAVAQWIKLQVS